MFVLSLSNVYLPKSKWNVMYFLQLSLNMKNKSLADMYPSESDYSS